jgi:hypothetical protein
MEMPVHKTHPAQEQTRSRTNSWKRRYVEPNKHLMVVKPSQELFKDSYSKRRDRINAHPPKHAVSFVKSLNHRTQTANIRSSLGPRQFGNKLATRLALSTQRAYNVSESRMNRNHLKIKVFQRQPNVFAMRRGGRGTRFESKIPGSTEAANRRIVAAQSAAARFGPTFHAAANPVLVDLIRPASAEYVGQHQGYELVTQRGSVENAGIQDANEYGDER